MGSFLLCPLIMTAMGTSPSVTGRLQPFDLSSSRKRRMTSSRDEFSSFTLIQASKAGRGRWYAIEWNRFSPKDRSRKSFVSECTHRVVGLNWGQSATIALAMPFIL